MKMKQAIKTTKKKNFEKKQTWKNKITLIILFYRICEEIGTLFKTREDNITVPQERKVGEREKKVGERDGKNNFKLFLTIFIHYNKLD